MDGNGIWTLREKPTPGRVEEMARALGVRPLLASLLLARGMEGPEQAARFLRPSLSDLHDPFRMKDMDRATERIAAAVKRRETIGLFGDFDVDGVSGAALLARCLRREGVDPLVRLPRRLTEGYDLSAAAVEEFAAAGVSLLVTVDCGVTAIASLEEARRRGIDSVVSDHHEPKGTLPPAHAVVDPRRADCPYPEKDLAGVGIAWKLADALASGGIGLRDDLLLDLDLVAIGTIADVAPLTGENRYLVSEGLRVLAASQKPGLRALLEVSGFAYRDLDYASIAFGLGPRLNAAGRLGDAAPALELLTTDSRLRARELAVQLDRMNKERRALDERMLEEALEKIGEEPEPGGIVVASREWHPGVIGIVASRLKETTGFPAVLIAVEDGIGRGSARSVPGFPLHEAFEACADLLLRHGGHAMAAGLTIEETKIAEFRARFRGLFEEKRRGLPPPATLELDAEIALGDCGPDLLRDLERLEPFGPGNRRPIFLARDVSVPEGYRPVGKNHLRFRAKTEGASLDAIAFQVGHAKAGEWGRHPRLDVAFTLEVDQWGGESRLRMNVKGVREASRDR
ncbi:MAG: single-stranded-DNA-specific exonuclease RecJ [Candidatus Latescibacterota bacterium]|nr:MAG: single-stranded-DNA-specific exonuclease RecJ [Candidatus Latescibacterota bacterium]